MQWALESCCTQPRKLYRGRVFKKHDRTAAGYLAGLPKLRTLVTRAAVLVPGGQLQHWVRQRQRTRRGCARGAVSRTSECS